MKILFTSLLLLLAIFGHSQKSYTVNGYIKDAATGETLIAANIVNKADVIIGTSTNTYGFYSLTLPEGALSQLPRV